jgi:hydroxymethylpyrimidine kinase/phosphomethylpyrimidine kinase
LRARLQILTVRKEAETTLSVPVLLSIAGFDPSCGAGVAADLKTFAVHDCYGVAAITALTVQSTQGVRAVHAVAPQVLRAQLEALAEDVTIAAVKIGMLANQANAAVVAEFLDRCGCSRVVLDPVLQASQGGLELLDAAGLDFLREQLLKRATVVTPNLQEAEALTGVNVRDVNGMKAAAQKLVEMGARAALVKGGHLERPVDVLCDGHEIATFSGEVVKNVHRHGSGCSFSSALAAQLALGRSLADAIPLAKAFVAKAIEHGFAIGKGPGPVNPFYRFRLDAASRLTRTDLHTMHPSAEPTYR